MSRDRVPLWMPAPNYYLLVVFIAGALFLSVLAVLHDGSDDYPWMIATLSAGAFAGSLFLFREVVLRRFRRRAIAARRLSQHLRTAASAGRRDEPPPKKITLQRNEEILHNIRKKSDAAKLFGRVADAHKEVFDLCEEYMTVASAEIASARPGSPRIPALIKGSKFTASRHRYHMLKWAEIKARSFTDEAAAGSELSDKVAAAEDALTAVDRAMKIYPDDAALVDSRALLRVFLVSARIKRSIERAEHASSGGSSRKAIDHYNEALSELEAFDIDFSERKMILERIQSEIGRIRKMAES